MRLIDADELIATYPVPSWFIINILDKAPTVDAVPVLRCWECKWFGKIGCAIEVVDETDMPKENDFCSFAERRNNETD